MDIYLYLIYGMSNQLLLTILEILKDDGDITEDQRLPSQMRSYVYPKVNQLRQRDKHV